MFLVRYIYIYIYVLVYLHVSWVLFPFADIDIVDFTKGRQFQEVAPFSQGEFSIHWDPGRLSWQWGRHGRLTMQWLGIDSIAWVPDMCLEGNHGKLQKSMAR